MSEQQTKTQTRKRQAAKAAGQSVSTTATVVQDPLLQTAQTQSQAVSGDAVNTTFDADGQLKAQLDAQAKADEQAKLNPTNLEGSNENSLSKTDLNVTGSNALAIVGAFTVRAKADAGFWRSGVQFHRLTETLVLVVDDESAAKDGVHSPNHDAERVVLLTREKAERVHREPNLVVEDVDLETLIDPASVIDLATASE
ncbi:MAG: hypothetical protein ACRDD9_03660 [Shewanella sp.]